MNQFESDQVTAIGDFHRARRRAALATIVARLIGRSDDLLSYEDVRQKLRGKLSSRRELRDIPLDAIVGSVGRYGDFNRHFLPRNALDAERWARVKQAMEGLSGVPPIEVYQVGDAYFVLDGNHRVSVARESSLTHIQAYVTPVETKVAFHPGDSPDDLIVKAEQAEFLEQTELNNSRPEANFRMTAPGQYRHLIDAIEAQRLRMEAEQRTSIDFSSAAANWYDNIYVPTIKQIGESRLLEEFPDRTEADLYVWIAMRRAELGQQLGWEFDNAEAARDLARQREERQAGPLSAVGKLMEVLTPDPLEGGPAPGTWRRERNTAERHHLFETILVGISGTDAGWMALEQALPIATRETARLNGLHLVHDPQAIHSTAAQKVQQQFNQRCQSTGIPGNLVVDHGPVAETIAERARYADLVVVSLSYPPGADPLTRLRSGFRALIQRCPRPILAVPQLRPQLERALLCYDGSPKSQEALYIAAYLAWRWRIKLTVATIYQGDDVSAKTLAPARRYLEEAMVRAQYISEAGPIAETLLRLANHHNSDLILIGGYGTNPLLGMVLGSTVDHVLRESSVPVLICR